MTHEDRTQIAAALNEAFDVHVGRLFAVLVENLVENTTEQTAVGRFQRGLDLGLRAKAAAFSLIEPIHR